MQYKHGEIRQVEKSLDDPEDGFISSKISLNVFFKWECGSNVRDLSKVCGSHGVFSTVGSGLGL